MNIKETKWIGTGGSRVEWLWEWLSFCHPSNKEIKWKKEKKNYLQSKWKIPKLHGMIHDGK